MLPPEVWDMVFGSLKADKKTLSSCAHTCRTWHILTGPYLFQSITFIVSYSPSSSLTNIPAQARRCTKHLRVEGANSHRPYMWVDASCLKLIMEGFEKLHSLSLQNLYLNFEHEYPTDYERFKIKKLKMHHVATRHCCGFFRFLSTFSDIDVFDYSNVSVFPFPHFEEGKGTCAVSQLAKPRISALKTHVLDATACIWLLQHLLATSSSEPLASLDLTCSSLSALQLCAKLDTTTAQSRSLNLDVSLLKPEYGQLLELANEPFRRILSKYPRLHSLGIAIAFSVLVGENKNFESWTLLLNFIQSAPSSIRCLNIGLVCQGMLDWVLDTLDWKSLGDVLQRFDELEALSFTNRCFPFLEEEEAVIRRRCRQLHLSPAVYIQLLDGSGS